MHLFCKNEKEHVWFCNVNLQYEALLALIPKNTTMDATPDRQLDRVESEGKSLLAVFPGKRIARLDVNCHGRESGQGSFRCVVKISVPGGQTWKLRLFGIKTFLCLLSHEQIDTAANKYLISYYACFVFAWVLQTLMKTIGWYLKNEDGSLGEDVVNNVLVSFVLPGADVPHQVAHARHKLLEVHLRWLNVWNVCQSWMFGKFACQRWLEE